MRTASAWFGVTVHSVFALTSYYLCIDLQENVGIVEFNSSARVVQSLTNNYQRCRRAIGESSL